ncbi:DUF3087 family protein, partial [Shewanella sp.]
EANDPSALTLLLFYFTSQKLVYLLDDNTLTLNQVDKELDDIKQRIEALGLEITVQDFNESLLEKF